MTGASGSLGKAVVFAQRKAEVAATWRSPQNGKLTGRGVERPIELLLALHLQRA